MEQDIKLEHMHKANIGDVVEEHEVEADEEEITDYIIDPYLKETYVSNIKRDDNKKEDEIIEDYIDQEQYEPKKGSIIKDKDWEEGFFLKTFPYLFICSEDNPTGGDITFIPKDERLRSDVWFKFLVKYKDIRFVNSPMIQ